jgi:hypothetical protein
MYSEGDAVSVFIEGNLFKGVIVAVARDDEGKSAYEVKGYDSELGAPEKWFKGSDVFKVETPAMETWKRLGS